MTDLTSIGVQAATMTSREIADLVGSRHDNVRVTIERLAERGVIALPAMQENPPLAAPLRSTSSPATRASATASSSSPNSARSSPPSWWTAGRNWNSRHPGH